MTTPRISVIIPVYNADRFIAEAIESVLVQQPAPVDIICVDDGSTDGSAAVVQSFGAAVRYVRQENRGPAAARNAAFPYVTGDFVAFLDADDVYPPEKFARQLAYFDADPTLDIVFGKAEYVFMDGSQPERYHFPDGNQTVWNILLGAGLIRSAVFGRIGLFDETLRMGEDLDWYNRAKEQGLRIRTVDERLLYYRQHKTNMTRDLDTVKHTMFKTLKQSLDRRRAQSEEVRQLPTFVQLSQPTPTPQNPV